MIRPLSVPFVAKSRRVFHLKPASQVIRVADAAIYLLIAHYLTHRPLKNKNRTIQKYS